jgi:hypothetical protein
MRLGASIVTLICGIVALVGVFLPWWDMWGFGTYSGWKIMTELGEELGGSVALFPYPLFLLVGCVVAILCALLLIIFSMTKTPSAQMIRSLSVVAVAGIAIAAGPALVILINAAKADMVGYGLYMSGIVAAVGIIPAVIAATQPIRRRRVQD